MTFVMRLKQSVIKQLTLVEESLTLQEIKDRRTTMIDTDTSAEAIADKFDPSSGEYLVRCIQGPCRAGEEGFERGCSKQHRQESEIYRNGSSHPD